MKLLGSLCDQLQAFSFCGESEQLVLWQALLQILKATWACLGALNGDHPNIELVTSCAFGGAAVLLGTFGESPPLWMRYFLEEIVFGTEILYLMHYHHSGKVLSPLSSCRGC